jgi:hypothetical protein
MNTSNSNNFLYRSHARPAVKSHEIPALSSINEGTELCFENVQDEESKRGIRINETNSLSETFMSLNQEKFSRSRTHSNAQQSGDKKIRNRLKKGPNSQSFIAVIATINAIYNFLPFLISLMWAVALYFSMTTVSAI